MIFFPIEIFCTTHKVEKSDFYDSFLSFVKINTCAVDLLHSHKKKMSLTTNIIAVWYNECTNILVKNEFKCTEENVLSRGVMELLGLLDDREKSGSVT